MRRTAGTGGNCERNRKLVLYTVSNETSHSDVSDKYNKPFPIGQCVCMCVCVCVRARACVCVHRTA